MKKTFAVFCALFLMPMFSAQAWIGGPFSNNSFFGESGDDGVYEATATTKNGIGLYRIVVGNDFEGSQEIVTAPSRVPLTDGQGNLIGFIDTVGVNSGNVIIGAFGQASNLWFIEGVSYSGRTTGTVNSVSGAVVAVATAQDSTSTLLLSSAFRARILGTGRSLPVSSFVGRGRGSVAGGATPLTFRFSVFGSKVSNDIFFGL